jgi:hypothetical protein
MISLVTLLQFPVFQLQFQSRQVAECSISRARPRIIRGLGRVLRKNRNTDTLCAGETVHTVDLGYKQLDRNGHIDPSAK